MKSKATRVRCNQCTRGVILYYGRALDGRPEFICSACGRRITNGHDGREYAALVPKEPTP